MTICATKEIKSLLGNNFSNLESASLRLNKFTVIGDKTQKDQLEAVLKTAEKNAGMFKAKDYSDFPNAKSFTMKLMGRMMVNQAEGVFENAGIKLHRHFGYPVIPGSALKGIARHAAWWEWDCEKDNTLAKEIAEIFGYPTGEKQLDDTLKKLGLKDTKGKVSFLDAVPETQDWKLTVDILTPHGGCDTKNPTPITFPAVEKGINFNFTVISKDKTVCSKAVGWLKKALEEDGIGAKTAAGYGWFEEVN